MRTTTEVTNGEALRDPATHARAIVEQLLASRDSLPHGLNGHPKAPSSSAAAQIRKEMAAGRSGEIRRLLTVLGCDVRDGVPLSAALATLDQMAAYLRLVAGDRAPEPRDLAVLHCAETRAQARMDVAQIKADREPASEAALTDVVRAKSEYDVWYDRYVQNIHARLAFLRGQKPSTVEISR